MTYKELLEIYKSNNVGKDETEIKRILSPLPVENAEDVEKIIPYRFRYTGPGKWVRILKERTPQYTP